MVVVKSVVVVTTLIAGTGRAVVVTVVTVGIPAAAVATTTLTAALGLKPDRPAVSVPVNTGSIVMAVAVTVVEEDVKSFVTLKLSLSF